MGDAQNVDYMQYVVEIIVQVAPVDMASRVDMTQNSFKSFGCVYRRVCRERHIYFRRHGYCTRRRPLPGEERQVLGNVCDALPLPGGRVGSA